MVSERIETGLEKDEQQVMTVIHQPSEYRSHRGENFRKPYMPRPCTGDKVVAPNFLKNEEIDLHLPKQTALNWNSKAIQ